MGLCASVYTPPMCINYMEAVSAIYSIVQINKIAVLAGRSNLPKRIVCCIIYEVLDRAVAEFYVNRAWRKVRTPPGILSIHTVCSK